MADKCNWLLIIVVIITTYLDTFAECLKALGHMEVAAQSYTKVVDMAPQHLEARLSLATLQQQLGRPDCALKALESMYDSDTLAQDSSAAQKV